MLCIYRQIFILNQYYVLISMYSFSPSTVGSTGSLHIRKAASAQRCRNHPSIHDAALGKLWASLDLPYHYMDARASSSHPSVRPGPSRAGFVVMVRGQRTEDEGVEENSSSPGPSSPALLQHLLYLHTPLWLKCSQWHFVCLQKRH